MPIVPGERALSEASQTPVGPTEHLVLRELGVISMGDFSLVLVLTATPSRWAEADCRKVKVLECLSAQFGPSLSESTQL